jgi:hypothetical protein
VFSAPINFDIELNPVTFIQRRHARAFNRRDVNKRIRLAIIALDKAKAFHRVEELNRACCRFAGQFTLWCTAAAAEAAAFWPITRVAITWRRPAVCHRQRITFNDQISCGNLSAAINQCELHRLPFGKTGQTSLFNSRDMDEYVFSAVITHNKAETFLSVEEFYDARAFADDLCWHLRSGCAAAAETTAAEAITATAAAAEAITATAATAKSITATAEAIAASAKAAIKAIISEAVSLVSATSTALTAPPSIKSHALKSSLRIFQSPSPKKSHAGRLQPTL